MSLLLLLLGFLPLALIGLMLFTISFVDWVMSQTRWLFGLFFLLGLFFFSLKLHALALQFFERHFKSPYHWKKTDTTTVILIITSALITFSLGHTFQLGAFVSSAVVGLSGSIFLNDKRPSFIPVPSLV